MQTKTPVFPSAGGGPEQATQLCQNPVIRGKLNSRQVGLIMSLTGADMTADLATVPKLRDSLELSGRDRKAAEAVASGLRDAKAENTRRSYASAWRRFQAWADAGGHPALPATPR